ncbi:PqiC family protein [Cypionkella sp.]|uniref:PqiC family protein n=1 Tax=Cypionkella sp. TaxID=2811411 RepID=UPI002AB88985|nr:PqiC family protein [Cypionkella sp.]MDZ4395420.1 PqiC family protein [Cypionkella sp.]
MHKTLIILLALASLTACGDKKARFEIPAPTAATEARLRVSSIEVRDVSLPAYASASEIVVEDAAGALRPVPKAIWADDPARGVTGALARSLEAASTANVAAEPWPLNTEPQARVQVRIDQMSARADGSFYLEGQFAISSASGAVSDSLNRFAISVPMADLAPASVAGATGAALDQLAAKIIATLKG